MAEMSKAEWESLCDGCGRCCLNKLIDEDTNQTVYTDVGCKLLDGQTCKCTDYPRRQAKVKDCVRLTPRNVKRLYLAATDLRLSSDRQRPEFVLALASAGVGRSGDGARGRHLRARPRHREREGRAGLQARGIYRPVGRGSGPRARSASRRSEKWCKPLLAEGQYLLYMYSK